MKKPKLKKVEIPYETVTKDVSQSGTETEDSVIQEGENGLVVYIPYFANYSNGGWFVVEDRGGAITDAHIDV